MGELYIYIHENNSIWGKMGKKHTPSNEKITKLFNSVNTGRSLNITTGSEQLVNEGRKKKKNLFTFSVLQV